MGLSQLSGGGDDEKIMAPEELHLDSPEMKSTLGGGLRQPMNSGPLNMDSSHLSTNTADDSSGDSMSDLVCMP